MLEKKARCLSESIGSLLSTEVCYLFANVGLKTKVNSKPVNVSTCIKSQNKFIKLRAPITLFSSQFRLQSHPLFKSNSGQTI